jgi:hypothetical protein
MFDKAQRPATRSPAAEAKRQCPTTTPVSRHRVAWRARASDPLDALLARAVGQRRSATGLGLVGLTQVARGPHALLQRTKNAYRVEYPRSYKIQLNDTEDKVVGFRGVNDGKGINISFIKPDHSEYFIGERGQDQQKGLRTVAFEISDSLWDAIEYKATNKTKKQAVADTWLKQIEKLSNPSWSDGKNLTTDIKQTALGFADGWLDVLIKGVVNGASVTYVDEDQEHWDDATRVWAYAEGTNPRTEGDEYSYREAQDIQFEHIMSVGAAERRGYKT